MGRIFRDIVSAAVYLRGANRCTRVLLRSEVDEFVPRAQHVTLRNGRAQGAVHLGASQSVATAGAAGRVVTGGELDQVTSSRIAYENTCNLQTWSHEIYYTERSFLVILKRTCVNFEWNQIYRV